MTFTRAWAAEFRIADTDPDQRTIVGIAVPFNDPTPIYEHGRLFTETIEHGAFRDSLAKRGTRMPILLHHDQRALPVGRPSSLRETPVGLMVEARISDTTDGNDALTLVRDGVLDGLSIGFSVPEGGDTWNSRFTERSVQRANLHEISLVNFPAYDAARITAVRQAADVPVEPAEPVAGHRLHVLRLQMLDRELAERALKI